MFFLRSRSISPKLFTYLCALWVCTMHAQSTEDAVTVVIGNTVQITDSNNSIINGSVHTQQKYTPTPNSSSDPTFGTPSGAVPTVGTGYSGPNFYYGFDVDGPAPVTNKKYQVNAYGLQAQTGDYTDSIATYFYTDTSNPNANTAYKLEGGIFNAYIRGGDGATFDARFLVLNENQGEVSYYLSSDVNSYDTNSISVDPGAFSLNTSGTVWYEYSNNDGDLFFDSTASVVQASSLNNIVGVGVFFQDNATEDLQMILSALEVDLMSIAIPELQSFSLVSGLLVFVGIMSRRRSFL